MTTAAPQAAVGTGSGQAWPGPGRRVAVLGRPGNGLKWFMIGRCAGRAAWPLTVLTLVADPTVNAPRARLPGTTQPLPGVSLTPPPGPGAQTTPASAAAGGPLLYGPARAPAAPHTAR